MEKIKYSEKEIRQLSDEFKKIETIKDKLDFWFEKFEIPYKERDRNYFELKKSFEIKPQNIKDKELINTYSLELFQKKFDKKNTFINSFDLFKNSFDDEYKKVGNKENLIKREIAKISNIIIECPKVNFPFLAQVYDDYYITNKEPNYRKQVLDIKSLIEINNGFVLAKYHKYIEARLQESKNKENPIFRKIKWNGTPSLFSYLFIELLKKGYIEAPLHNGEASYAGLAKDCFNAFEIKTTLDNLIRDMNPDKCSLSETKRNKFNIPQLADLK